MELTITPEVEALLQQQLATGRFEDANQLITIAMEVLADATPHDLDHFLAEIDESLDQIDRGQTYSEAEARAYLREVRAKL